MDEIVICPNCRTENPPGNARCSVCAMPFTTYAGQLTDERYQGNLAAQVSKLEKRPLMVNVMAGFHLFFALFWPLASMLGAFATRVKVNEEGTNYVAASVGSIGPIMVTMVCLPFFIAFLVVAYGTWTQRDWGYWGSLGMLGLFAVLALPKFGATPVLAVLWIALSVTGAALWLKSDVKAWYALD
ncbi:hypothetical protein LBMAG21_14040 [Armatimonadota bacterium]|nr:hypothetical protein LBMAG21_14040 [Armatimonadota bacterium]